MCLTPQISQPKLGQIIHVGGVLKMSGPADFKSVPDPTFLYDVTLLDLFFFFNSSLIMCDIFAKMLLLKLSN